MIFSIETTIAVAILATIPIAISLWLKNLSSFRTIRNRHVVITGGSSGIGLSIAIRCVKLGAHVTILARSVEKLESAIEVIKRHRTNDKQMIQFGSIDLSKSDEAVKTMFSNLENDVGPIYWLVNCAGGVMHGRIIDMFPDDPVHLMNIKYYAVYYPTRFVLEKMKAIGEGIITITGSQAKELVMEIYGHGPHGECKLSSLGLAKIINAKGPHSKISITLALEGHMDAPALETLGNGQNEEQTMPSGINSADLEEVANQIVHDSLGGKFISTPAWESWLLVTFWKIGHLLRAALLKAQVKYRKRYGHARTRVSSPTISSESPVETIDSSSSKSIETEPVSGVLSGSVESATIMADPDSSESNDLDNGTVKQDDAVSNHSLAQPEDRVITSTSSSNNGVDIASIPTEFGSSKEAVVKMESSDTFTAASNTVPGFTFNSDGASVNEADLLGIGSTISTDSAAKSLGKGKFPFSLGIDTKAASSHSTVPSSTSSIFGTNTSSLAFNSKTSRSSESTENTNNQAKPESLEPIGQALNATKTISTSHNTFTFGVTVPKASSFDSPTTQSAGIFCFGKTNPSDGTGASSTDSSAIPSKLLRTESELEITSHQNKSSSRFGNQTSYTNDLFSLFGPSENAAPSGRPLFGSRGVKHASDATKFAKKFEADENTPPQTASDVGVIGMEMFLKKQAEKKKPSFSFNMAVNNNDGLNSAGEDSQKTKMNELGATFSFNTNTNSDSSKPFTFEAKGTDDLPGTLESAGTNIKQQSHLPIRKANRRIK